MHMRIVKSRGHRHADDPDCTDDVVAEGGRPAAPDDAEGSRGADQGGVTPRRGGIPGLADRRVRGGPADRPDQEPVHPNAYQNKIVGVRAQASDARLASVEARSEAMADRLAAVEAKLDRVLGLADARHAATRNQKGRLRWGCTPRPGTERLGGPLGRRWTTTQYGYLAPRRRSTLGRPWRPW